MSGTWGSSCLTVGCQGCSGYGLARTVVHETLTRQLPIGAAWVHQHPVAVPFTGRPVGGAAFVSYLSINSAGPSTRAKDTSQISASQPGQLRANFGANFGANCGANFGGQLWQVVEALWHRFRRKANGRTTARVLAACVLSLLGITCHDWSESGEPDIAPIADQVLATHCEVACAIGSPARPPKR
jgi:hypothetical protein